MQELVGRLTALDPAASETLRVVSYFDALIARGVGLDGLLRAAAALSGVVAGAETRGRTRRFDPAGRVVPGPAETPTRRVQLPFGGAVWIERGGPPHVNDEMILERLALAVGLIEAHHHPADGLDIIIDAERSADERATALARLRIGPHERIRLVATDVDAPWPGAPHTELPTRFGILRATLDRQGALLSAGRVGLGPWVRADLAPESWDGAVIAYRLATASVPVVDATDLGAMLILARAYDPEHPHHDVTTLAGLDARSAEILRVLVESDSIRAAAAALTMHHSTVQARHESLSRELGYDPRTTGGRMRYIAAEVLRRLGRQP